MEIKVGDYVRYKKLIYHNQGIDDIRISKIKDIEDAIETGYNQKFIFFENGNGEYEDRIIKSSPNIIDLIEVGDYVNGRIVNDYIYLDKLGLIGLTELEKEDEKFIKSIVTKEQFKSMEYKVND